MSKQSRSTKWFIRITAPHDHCRTKLADVLTWVDHKCSAVGYHIGKKTQKPHIHIAMEMLTDLQKQSLDTRLKKLFDVKGSDYSSKAWDGSHKALSYLYHDKEGKVEYHKMELSDEEKKEIETTVAVYNEIVTTAKEKASTRIPDRILEEMGKDQWDELRVIKRIYQGVRAREWYDPGPMMDRYINEILCRSSGERDYVNELAEQKWNRRRGFH